MTSLFSAQNSWLRYFTELSNGHALRSDDTKVADTGSKPEANEANEPDFEAVLQKTIAEYGATRDHLEMLEKKLAKMMEIKETKARNDFEIAKRNLELSEKESTLVRKILGSGHDDDTDTIRGEKKKEQERPISPPTHGNEEEDKALPNLSAEERAHALAEELEEAKQKVALEAQGRLHAENSLAAAEAQVQVDLAQARITLKNEAAARVKADGLAAEETKARYTAEQEIQRLRTELKLVGMDARQQRGGIPFAMGQTEKRDHWLETRSPEELHDLQLAVAKAMEGGNKNERRRTLDGFKKRKLSKSHKLRSPSADVVANGIVGEPGNVGEAI